MKHLDESELSAVLDRALEDRARVNAERHLADCATCRAALGELEAQDRALARALDHDPGEAYFESFAARVQERIRAEGVASGVGTLDTEAGETRPARAPRAAVAPASMLDRLGRWFSGPRLAWVGAAAAVIVGAGVVFMIGDQKPVRTLQDRDLTARSDQVAEGKSPGTQATMAAPERESRANAAPDAPVAELGERDQARAPATFRAQETAPAEPAGKKLGEVHGQDDVSSTAPQTQSAPPLAAAKPVTGATPGRSREVRRQGGEDVPVRTSDALGPQDSQRAPGFAPAPSSAGDARTRAQRIKEAAREIVGGPLDAKSKARDEAAKSTAGTYAFDDAGAVRVCGAVRNASGQAIAGARVAFADLGASTTTDAAGHWCLEAAPGEHTVTVMAVGFREVRRSFPVAAGAGDQDFTLAAVSVLGDPAAEGKLAASPWPPAAQAIAVAAENASRDADLKSTAAAYDNAATHWQRVTDAVKVGPAAIAAKRSLADARYRAWQLDPSSTRSVGAIAALSSYLTVAPAGAERERTQRRLDQVRHR